MLQLEHISWNTADGKSVLKNVNLTIEDGKVIVMTGPNGGGKSTLGKIIAGIEKPTKGRILLDGEDITGLNATERAKKGISFAFQQPVRFKGITVSQLLKIASGEQRTETQLADILHSVGLSASNYLNREINGTLSGGEMKRIEIATVLARNSKVTVFDEPEAGIDLWSFSSLIQVFQKMRGDLNGNVLIISHQERIFEIADEIVVLTNGKVKSKGAAKDMLKKSLSCAELKKTSEKQEALL